MNTEDIRVLAEIVQRAGLTKLKIKEGDLHILIERQPQAAAVPQPAFMPVPADLPQDDQVVDFNRLKEVKAPMVGVFYPAPAPGAPAFVKIVRAHV